jgi:hypothetical protein
VPAAPTGAGWRDYQIDTTHPNKCTIFTLPPRLFQQYVIGQERSAEFTCESP